MARRTFTTVAALSLLLAGGCAQNSEEFQTAKEKAKERWTESRAMVLCGLAEKQLKSGQLDRAHRHATDALTLKPQLLRARVVLGRVLIEKGLYESAIETLREAGRQAPESYEACYFLGVALEKRGRFGDALASYQRSHELNGRRMESVLAIGELLVAMGEPSRAQSLVETYTDDSGFGGAALYELAGRIALVQRQPDRAARHFRTALDLDPDNLRYRELLARAQVLSGRYEEASGTLGLLIEAEGYTPPATVWSMLGDCRMARSQPDEAREAYRQVTRLRPEDGRGWTCLARAQLALGDAGQAEASANRALGLSPRDVESMLLLAHARTQLGRSDEAIEVLRRARRIEPDNLMVLCLLGRAYSASGRTDKALACLDRARRIEPGNPLVRTLTEACRQGSDPR